MCHPALKEALTFARHLEDLARLRRVRDRLDREYALPLDVEALARGVRMPAGLLSRQFLLAYGQAPHGYLTARRIERAVAILCRGGPGAPGVAEIRSAVGCPSPETFGARFTAVVGVPPGVYRRQAARGGADLPPDDAGQVPGPVRNREARLPEPRLA
ncbi:helix-turn-helix domain-containing protein [Actinacidiphila rubida]|uniref:AraC-type DNA-binding protein n=1 Tax=Actinacidiphila rubida TaxID=310780 RepID=A0A1H8LJZ4_9ACTN|nr:helix-turn-helix domain-containing protein [Actinacidiphila rubida]SEO05088.1 AraC-type DNA-binding protein [Actinacidiphila rubida]